MNQDIDSPSFIVEFMDGREDKYLNNSTTQYHWSITPNGDLLIWYKQMHHMFSAAVVKDERIKAHAASTWRTITTSDEVEPEVELDE